MWGTRIREGYLFFEKRYPSLAPSQRKFTLQASSSKSCGACRLHFPARGVAALGVAIRFASAPIIRCCAAVGGSAALRMRHTPCGCRSAHLVEVQTNLLLPTLHTVSIMRTAASEAMPLRQAIPGLIESEVERSYVRVMNRRQSDSEDRRKSNRLDTSSSRHLIAQRVQFFKLQSRNVGGRGGLPSHFSWGSKGGILFGKRIPPLTAHSHANGRPPRALWARYLRRYHVPAHRQQCHAARKAHHRRL